jgi:hypothetical protein
MSDQEQPERRGWGGKRAGAGRPPDGEEPTVRRNVYLEPGQWRWLEARGPDNGSAALRAMVARAMEAEAAADAPGPRV